MSVSAPTVCVWERPTNRLYGLRSSVLHAAQNKTRFSADFPIGVLSVPSLSWQAIGFHNWENTAQKNVVEIPSSLSPPKSVVALKKEEKRLPF